MRKEGLGSLSTTSTPLFFLASETKGLSIEVPTSSPAISPENPRGYHGISPLIPGDLVHDPRRTFEVDVATSNGSAVGRRQKFCAEGDDSYIGTYTHRSMMAQAARRKQGSSVALQVFQPCRVNNLQEEKEIFFSSVALRKNTGSGVPIQVYGKDRKRRVARIRIQYGGDAARYFSPPLPFFSSVGVSPALSGAWESTGRPGGSLVTV